MKVVKTKHFTKKEKLCQLFIRDRTVQLLDYL